MLDVLFFYYFRMPTNYLSLANNQAEIAF